MLVSHIYKFIYIKNRKVAGTSVEAFFQKYCVDPNEEYVVKHVADQLESEFGIVGYRCGKGKKWFNHSPARYIKKNIGKDIFDSYFKFCVVRNPYDKIVSFFMMKTKEKNKGNIKSKFKQFCKTSKCNDMDKITIGGVPVCDFYIRYENLKEDIEKVCKILKIENYDIDSLHNFKSEYRPKGYPYQSLYDEETKKIVYNKHKNEIEMFGYEF